MLKLTIKGSLTDAQTAAEHWGITLLTPAEKRIAGDPWVEANCPSTELRRVFNWFGDSNALPAPLPPGSLLWYRPLTSLTEKKAGAA
jgi:hypothetical protein